MDRFPGLKVFVLFILGILTASAVNIPFMLAVIILSVLIVISIPGFIFGFKWNSLVLFLIVLGMGIFSYQAHHRFTSEKWGNGQEKKVVLEIISEPRQTVRSWKSFGRILSENDGENWQPVDAKALVYLNSDGQASIDYGDIVIANGTWKKAAQRRNPGGFDYREYLDNHEVQGIFTVSNYKIYAKGMGNPVMAGFIVPIRGYIRQTIDRYLNGDEASLLAGLLLGERFNLSQAVKEAFSDTGTTHVLAVSGLHAALVAFIIFIALRIIRLPKKAAGLGTIAGLLIYTMVAGASPSIVRSAIMVGMLLLGGTFERQGNSLNLLGVAGILILSFWPQALFDIGFQLSFAATAGILILTRPLEAAFYRLSANNILRKWILLPLAVSLAAQIFTAPLIALYFHRIPIISLLANLVVVPLTSMVLALGLSLTVANLLGSIISWPIAASAYLVSWSMLKLVYLFSSIKFGTLYWASPNFLQIALYGLAVALPFLWKRNKKIRLAIISGAFLLANLLLWNQALAKPQPLRITFLDVGQGDCALVEIPNGKKYLIDAGLYTPTRDSGKDVIVPFLRSRGITRLDGVVISHSDADHCGGLSYLLDHVKIGNLVTSDHPSSQPMFNRSLEQAKAGKATLEVVSGYDTLCGIWPARGFLYSREDSTLNGNESSLIFYLQYGKTNFLFSGDMGPELEDILLKKGLLGTCQVLKVPHHGARPNNPAGLTEIIHPELAIISVGENNRFGHPAQEALDNYAKCGSKIFRTDHCGAIIIESDGENITYKSMIE